MSFEKYGSDLDTCASCNATLTDHEAWICTTCNERAINDYNPSDHELTRNEALLHRFWTHGASAILFPILCLIIAGVSMVARDAQAQDTGMEVTRIINDRPYTWTLPEAGCQLLRGWEDMSAQAWCPSGLVSYDPDGSRDREAGIWYAVTTAR